jgi:hypothetical protein
MATRLMTTLSILMMKNKNKKDKKKKQKKKKKKKKKRQKERKMMRICSTRSVSAHQILVNKAPVPTLWVVVLLETFAPNATNME